MTRLRASRYGGQARRLRASRYGGQARAWLTIALAAASIWTGRGILAQAPVSPQLRSSEGGLKALTDEFVARRAASARGIGVLPTIEQATADSAWAEAFQKRLNEVAFGRLSHDDWITFAMLEEDVIVLKESAAHFWFDIPITPYASPLRGATATFELYPLGSDTARTAYLDALNRLPLIFASYEARLRSQMLRGIVAPSEELRLAIPYIRSFGVSAVASAKADSTSSSPFRPAAARLASLAPEVRTQFLQQVDAAIAEAVNPAVERLAAFLDGPYRAKAPAGVGLSQYPGGRAYYQYLIRRHTSLPLTPEQIHEIGLTEVRRLEDALEEVRRDAKFNGSFAEFRAYLRNDPRFRARSADDIATRMMSGMDRIEPVVDRFFSIKPKAPYGVKRLDPALEAAMTYGYYQRPFGAEQTGYYYFNADKPEERSILMAEATVYHELVPGHHFQIALQRENDSLTPYRRNYAFTAFTEGWAEYASDLAGEMGMYSDPYARAGRLAMDLFLSSRLVVDTGMNALGWPREKAMAFMRDHTFESDLQIDTETLRYGADNYGQALAYKLGARAFRQIRQRAEKELGGRFNLPAFHAWVLKSGAMPLSVLDGHTACFIAEKHAAR